MWQPSSVQTRVSLPDSDHSSSLVALEDRQLDALEIPRAWNMLLYTYLLDGIWIRFKASFADIQKKTHYDDAFCIDSGYQLITSLKLQRSC